MGYLRFIYGFGARFVPYVSSTSVPEFFLEIFFFAKERASRKVARRERKTRYELVYYASTQIIICDNYLL